VAHELGKDRRCRCRAPSPDGDGEWGITLRFVPTVVARADLLKVARLKVGADVLVLAGGTDGLPPREDARAVERHIVKGPVVASLSDENEIRLRVGRIGEENVSGQILIRGNDGDSLGITRSAARVSVEPTAPVLRGTSVL